MKCIKRQESHGSLEMCFLGQKKSDTAVAHIKRPSKVSNRSNMCHGQKSRFFGDGHPTINRNLYNGYINPYYWVDDHPLLYENNGSLDPSTYELIGGFKVRLQQILSLTRDYANLI